MDCLTARFQLSQRVGLSCVVLSSAFQLFALPGLKGYERCILWCAQICFASQKVSCSRFSRAPFSRIASAPSVRYKIGMKRGPNNGRCPAEDCRCLANCATGQSAFSLIELLIVAVLILFLTTMYWGGNAASRQRKLQMSCQQNLQKIFVAMQIYANDQAGKFPEVPGAR